MDTPTWKVVLSALLVCLCLRGDQVVPEPLTRAMLDESLALGRQFLLASQLPTGAFRYHVNLLTGEEAPEENAVRQAGALWGLALIHQDQPSAETREAVLRGLAFFSQHSHRTPAGRRFIRFPGDSNGDSGAVALVALALIDFLRAEPINEHAPLRQQLDEYLLFLQSLARADHRFYRQYLLSSGEGWGESSPYFDGEILLALVKAARYLQHEELQPLALRAAEATYAAYADEALEQRRDDPATKRYFQWACLACAELYASQWPDTQRYAQRAIELARWMIDVHHTLDRPLNTGYAYEGIISAYSLAQSIDDAASAEQFRRVIETGLAKLSTWQVGSAHANAYLRGQPVHHASCTGGVLSADQSPWLRIDTTQHQMHAVILARKHLWHAAVNAAR
jgi:UDP-N-acetylmuramoyl-tripeptide--D-alanyl-D-alanine ligase